MGECKPPFAWPVQKLSCPKCNNLLQNPSFEAGLTGWETDNVIPTDGNPFEGTQVASMRQGVASMFQDVSLAKTGLRPLFLSFNVFPGSDGNNNGNLIAEVLWLDANHNTIGSGLSLFIPNGRINRFFSRLTYFDITDRPPGGAAWARLLFSKGVGNDPDIIEIDQVILTPVGTINLVENPSFELGLTEGWTSTTFTPDFSMPFEGAADAVTSVNGTLFQDVPLTALPVNSSYLLSFAAQGSVGSMSVQVLWLDATDNQIGPPGLDIFIPTFTLVSQLNYLTYLDITDPAPAGAVKARILFTAAPTGLTPALRVDQVIMARASTTNLIQNPSFKDGLSNWTPVNTVLFADDAAYEGSEVARISDSGGVLYQDVPINNAVGHCFLFNSGVGYRRTGDSSVSGDMHIKVIWLDSGGSEIGLGLSIDIPSFTVETDNWLVYTGITEPAPLGTVKARVQFTKSSGTTGGFIDIDKVVLGRLI